MGLFKKIVSRFRFTNRENLGSWGERYCRRFLENKGYKHLKSNFFCKMGEIDLIMTHKDSVIVFVEVKTRKSDEYAQPEESVNYPKRKRMVRAAHYFLSQYKIEDRPLRFDVVAVVTGDNKQKPQIRHYENVFNG